MAKNGNKESEFVPIMKGINLRLDTDTLTSLLYNTASHCQWYYSTECPTTELSFISMQQGHFCLTQTFVTSCLHIGHKHF